MKIFVMSPDSEGHLEPTLNHTLFPYLANCESVEAADVVVVPVSYIPEAEINPALLDLRKPWVMIDFLEYFRAWDEKETHVMGVNDPPLDHYKTEQWCVLDDWISANPPIAYFKRELLLKDRSDWLLPIEWPCSITIPPIVERDEFEARNFELFNCWGLSNHDRAKFHGEIFMKMGENRLHVAASLDQMDYLNQNPHEMGDSRAWATVFIPHFCRIPMNLLIVRQMMAKIACSFPGSGTKCFRHAEAPVGTVMALPYDQFAWGIPWTHGENCIRFHDFDSLVNRIPYLDLYQIYLAGQETIRRYRMKAYARDYVAAEIQRVL